jgi:GR25 family glycosyltransferase involved in LPS biosynthesis
VQVLAEIPEDAVLPKEWLMPLALTLNETLSNALEHGFPDGREGRVLVKLEMDGARASLVIEDDALKIIPNFENIIFDLYKNLPEDWDVFLIGFSTFNETCKKVSEDIYKVKDFILAHCYLINKSGAKKLIDSLPINAPLDTFMSSVSNYVNIYRHNHLIRRDVTRKTSYLINQYGDVSQIKHTNIIES